MSHFHFSRGIFYSSIVRAFIFVTVTRRNKIGGSRTSRALVSSRRTHQRPIGDRGELRRAIRPSWALRTPMPRTPRAARADPRVRLPMPAAALTDCSSALASPAGGQGPARPRFPEYRLEAILGEPSVRSRSAVSSRVWPAMWQSILFVGGGTARLPCLPALACERAC